ncbi:hypothetical protein NMY3_00335 [Candidatus Nitrosocosmicus oleophilus]|uniref:Uncharacterized protein n=1 Tax=Candidatus Nitrosocosmicus oleophilus TaxID=1353260 RepID=A0A654LW07_9ARCH|nr:hypothetical protein NMY3_00335 [Candidatus Nitrosocosmicus oleophilus]
MTHCIMKYIIGSGNDINIQNQENSYSNTAGQRHSFLPSFLFAILITL